MNSIEKHLNTMFKYNSPIRLCIMQLQKKKTNCVKEESSDLQNITTYIIISFIFAVTVKKNLARTYNIFFV